MTRLIPRHGRPRPVIRRRRARSPLRTRPRFQAACPRSSPPSRPSILGRNIRTHRPDARISLLSSSPTSQLLLCSESLYESDQLPKSARDLAALLASKVYYYLGEYDEALSFALGAGGAFEAEARDYNSGEYVETVICTSLLRVTQACQQTCVAFQPKQ